MDPQQPTNPTTDDDVEGHRQQISYGGQDESDDVEGHLSGALGSKTDHER